MSVIRSYSEHHIYTPIMTDQAIKTTNLKSETKAIKKQTRRKSTDDEYRQVMLCANINGGGSLNKHL